MESTVIDYLQSKLDDINRFPGRYIAAYFGPYLATHQGEYPNRVKDMLRLDDSGLFQLVLALSEDIASESVQIGTMKRHLALRNKKMFAQQALEAAAHSDAVAAWTTALKKKQKESALGESAILNVAPIVPYEVVNLKKQEADPIFYDAETVADFATSSEYLTAYKRIVDTIKGELTDLSAEKVFDAVRRILRRYPYQILKAATALTHSEDNLKSYLTMGRDDDIFVYACAYYLLANSLIIENGISLLNKYINVYSQAAESLMKPHAFVAAIEAFEKEVETNDSDFEKYFSADAEKELIDYDAKLLDEKLASQMEESGSGIAFNLDKIFNFVNRHRQLSTGEEANHTFLTNLPAEITINNYDYFKDRLMVAQIKYNGETWTVTPVSDMLDHNKMKLICLDENGQLWFKPDLDFGVGNNMKRVS